MADVDIWGWNTVINAKKKVECKTSQTGLGDKSKDKLVDMSREKSGTQRHEIKEFKRLSVNTIICN